MFVSFDTLTENARIWIYQADRAFTASEEKIILEQGISFVNNWAAHGQPLQASLTTFHAHFLVIAVDDVAQLPSGCSIDQSVEFVRLMEQQLGLGFFNRTNVSVWHNNSVLLKDLATIKKEIQEGTMGENTLIFNNLIETKEDMTQWIIPIKNSWLARYFTQAAGN